MFLLQAVIFLAGSSVLLASTGTAGDGEVKIQQFRANFDAKYTLLATETKDYKFYDDKRTVKAKHYYFKKDTVEKNRYQAGYTSDSAYSVQQGAKNGGYTYYFGSDWENDCYSYKRPYMHDYIGSDFYSEYKLVNTRTEGSKLYLLFYYYHYNREEWMKTRGWWTTVYETETKSYLPYKKRIYRRYDDGFSYTNVTYVPTQFPWFKLPDNC